MLPFLKPKQMGAVIRVHQKEDGSSESMGPADEHDPGLVAAAEQLIKAVHNKDTDSVVDAFKSAYDILESQEKPEGLGEV